MKKLSTLFLSIILFGVANLASGQVQVALGLKGGLNLSKIDFSQGASNIDNRTGFHGGAFALFKLTKIGIQPEILFSKQGASYTVNTDNFEANFDYINVPIILKLYLAAGLNLQAGPQFGFLSTSELINTTTNVTDPQDAKSLFDKKSDLSIALGAGWDLPFGLTIDARYNIGVSDVKLSPTSSTPVDIKNKVIQVSLGYKLFKLGK
jgi:hypothetical protein